MPSTQSVFLKFKSYEKRFYDNFKEKASNDRAVLYKFDVLPEMLSRNATLLTET